MSGINPIVIITVVAALILLKILGPVFRKAKGPKPPKVKAKPLLTKAEQDFMKKLSAALPNQRIFTQVSMGALLQPPPYIRDQSERTRSRWQYSQKIVDFIVADPATFHVLAIVELDDHSHDTKKDAARDAMLESAGYKVARFTKGRELTVSDIRDAFDVVLNLRQ